MISSDKNNPLEYVLECLQILDPASKEMIARAYISHYGDESGVYTPQRYWGEFRSKLTANFSYRDYAVGEVLKFRQLLNFKFLPLFYNAGWKDEFDRLRLMIDSYDCSTSESDLKEKAEFQVNLAELPIRVGAWIEFGKHWNNLNHGILSNASLSAYVKTAQLHSVKVFELHDAQPASLSCH